MIMSIRRLWAGLLAVLSLSAALSVTSAARGSALRTAMSRAVVVSASGAVTLPPGVAQPQDEPGCHSCWSV